MSREACDLLVVGGGIVGAACALEAVRAGLSVCLCESGVVGGGATAAGMGHLVVMDDSEAQFSLTRRSLALWHQLAHYLPEAAEYHRSGTIWVAADELEMEEVWRKRDYFTQSEVRVEVLDSKQLAEAEPRLRPGLVGALLVLDDAVVYSPVVARYLIDQAVELGVVLLEGVSVRKILTDGVILDGGEKLSAGSVVNATGCHAPVLTPGIPVQKRKGHLLITDRYPGFVNHQLIELGYLKSAHTMRADSVAFNVQPRRTGQILIGSSRQFGALDSAVDLDTLDSMLTRAICYMPDLARLTAIRTWTGFRAATPDSLPLIGPVEGDFGRHWLATGHEGLGITTSLITAELLIDQIVGRTPQTSWAPYLPTRSIGEVHPG